LHYNFIEIGTSNFDAELQKCDDSATGLSIEPLQHYLDDLPNRINVRKICAALSNKPGFLNFHHVKPEIIRENKLPSWVRGCNTLDNPHPTIKKLLGKRYDQLITVSQVRVITWDDLIEENEIESIELLKVDTEGHDGIIIHEYLNCCEKNHKLLAKKIIFECNGLVPKNIENDNVARLKKFGYSVNRIANDYICYKQ
jgi:FkbM family methyltransferase